MSQALELSVVRIYKATGKIITGAGFLVAPRYILTCAHVAAYALEVKTQQLQCDHRIKINFPFLEISRKLETKIVFSLPINCHEIQQDIAVLEVLDELPYNAKPIALIPSYDECLKDCTFKAYGFPKGSKDGVWAYGIFCDRIARGRIQIEGDRKTGLGLEPGFSGTPIWSEELEGVVGMAIKEYPEHPESKVAFITSTDVLLEAWELSKVCLINRRIPAVDDEFSREIELKRMKRSDLVSSLVKAKESPPKLVDREESFEVAWIGDEKTYEFEFDVATLERRSRFLGLGDRWVIKKEHRKAIGIIEKLEENIKIELMEIPAGTFLMGSPKNELGHQSNEEPQHKVNIPAFFLSRYPVTQEQWRIVAGWKPVKQELDRDPSDFKESYEEQDRWTRPVDNISWLDAKEFCARLTCKTGKTYRLPTEAEWEYACRAKTTKPFHFGETIITDLANYDGTSSYNKEPKGEYRAQTTPIGYFRVANEFGLYDMHGNVREWCEDDEHNNYRGAPTDSSTWTTRSEDAKKVIRGGSWRYSPKCCRSAYRLLGFRDARDSNIGFRVARTI